jgi:hypothetical protein
MHDHQFDPALLGDCYRFSESSIFIFHRVAAKFNDDHVA